MRQSVEINDTLLRKALKASGLASKREVIEEGLRLLVKVHGQTSIRHLRGKITIDGDIRDSEIGSL